MIISRLSGTKRPPLKRRGPDPMVAERSTEEIFDRQLEALCIKLKSVVYGDIVYSVRKEYACKKCGGRLKAHSQGNIYCLCCQTPPTWSRQLKECVAKILMEYPEKVEQG